MRFFQSLPIHKAILPLFLLSLLAGCGHVAGNYPAQTAPKSLLPDEYKSPSGRKTSLVWVDPGRVHGFLSVWRDTEERAATFRKLYSDSGLEVHKEGAEMFAGLSEQGLAEAHMWVFFEKGIEIPVSKGDFEVQFSDGTTTRDLGIMRFEPRDQAKPYRFTRDGGVMLSDVPVGRGEPLRVLLFLPSDKLDQKIASVTCKPGG